MRLPSLLLLAALLPALALPAAGLGLVNTAMTAAAQAAIGGLLAAGEQLAVEPADMNRAMFYTTLSQAAGAEADDGVATNLKDVPAGQWYTGGVVWALSNGVAECRAADAFGVWDEITRAEVCVALWRADQSRGGLPAVGVLPFLDVAGLNGEERDAIAACVAAGVVEIRADGRVDPDGVVDCAEATEIFQRLQALPQWAPKDAAMAPVGSDGWTGRVEDDFPLGTLETVTAGAVMALNARILQENAPKTIAGLGTTLDGNERHLTNHGDGGILDCWNVETILDNRKTGLPAGVALAGRQEYYGYVLQVDGLERQDKWREEAERGGKEPWQCTWWAWGRAAQYLETAHGLDFAEVCDGWTALGNGEDYYGWLDAWFLSDDTPAPNSIISWQAGTYGHVAYVEAVDKGGIWVSMADSGHTWRGITYIARTDSETCPYPLNWFEYEAVNGFNHLDYAADGSAIGK